MANGQIIESVVFTSDVEIRREDRKRVKTGARWLDKTVPEWRTHINPLTLNVANGGTCVLAQVFKSEYNIVTRALKISYFDALAMGFIGHPNGCALYDELKSLTKAWLEEIFNHADCT